MFISNFSSIPPESIILVDSDTKRYLESIGFCVLSRNQDKYVFVKTDDLLNRLSLWEGGAIGNG